MRVMKVHEFHELKNGDRVAVSPCHFCGGEHVGQVVGKINAALAFTPGGTHVIGTETVKVMPPIPCVDSPEPMPWGIAEPMVLAGQVFVPDEKVN